MHSEFPYKKHGQALISLLPPPTEQSWSKRINLVLSVYHESDLSFGVPGKSHSTPTSTSRSLSPRMIPTRRDREDRRRDEPRRRESTRTYYSRKAADPNAFQVVKIIGEGSEGSCELLQRIGDGAMMVCKKAHILTDSMMVGNIPREVKILRDTLRPHPRIVNLMSYRISDRDELDTYYDYYPGGDLHRQLRPGSGSSEGLIWHVFRQMAEALAYLHTGYARTDPHKSGKLPHKWRPVVHCDIKPDNIFLTAPRTPDNPLPDLVLGDFGFAVVGDDRTGGGAPAYQPPEFPHNTPAADVWALGALIHQMAHGKLPVDFAMPRGFRGSEVDWLTHPMSKRVVPLPRGYSDALNGNMMDCLRLRPDERVSAYDLFRHVRRDGPRSG